MSSAQHARGKSETTTAIVVYSVGARLLEEKEQTIGEQFVEIRTEWKLVGN